MRGLAAAGGTQQGDDFFSIDLEIDVAQRDLVPAGGQTESFRDLLQLAQDAVAFRGHVNIPY